MTSDIGAMACGACKIFLGESIRRNQSYKIGFDEKYDIAPEDQCQYCRLRNNFKAINGEQSNTLTLKQIITADEVVRDLTNYNRFLPAEEEESVPEATANDFYDSTKEQLVHLVNWAKCIPAFLDLTIDDQVSLLKDHVGDNLILGLVRRSRHLKNSLLLGNGFLIRRGSKDILNVTDLILDELIAPLKRLDVDEAEFACLKAIVFFNSYVPGLKEPDKVRTLGSQALLLLEDYIIAQPNKPCRGRFGKILLTLPSLRSAMLGVINEMIYRKMLGTARIDILLLETILADDLENEFVLKCNVSGSSVKLSSSTPSQSPRSFAEDNSPVPQLVSPATSPELAEPERMDIFHEADSTYFSL